MELGANIKNWAERINASIFDRIKKTPKNKNQEGRDVNEANPAHYRDEKLPECFDVIMEFAEMDGSMAWACRDIDHYLIGNYIKYCWRAYIHPIHSFEVQIRKAAWHLQMHFSEENATWAPDPRDEELPFFSEKAKELADHIQSMR